MENPVRVLQILGDFAGGGVESVILNYYKNIDRKKIQFDFIVHDNSSEDILPVVSKMGAKVFKVPSCKRHLISYMLSLYRIIKNEKYQIVHSNMSTLSFFSLLVAKLCGTEIRILHNHTTSTPAEKINNWLKLILRPLACACANTYWACSEHAADWMFGKKGKIRASAKIVNNAINLVNFAFNNQARVLIRNKYGLENDFVIGFVGRLVYQKNPMFALEVYNEFQRNIKNSKLLIIGDGPLCNELKKTVMNLGLNDKVLFLGIQHNVNDFYSAMDAFIFPSRYEGFGMAALEAQISGLQCLLSTNVPKEAVVVQDCVKYLAIKNIQLWVNELMKDFKKNKNRSMTIRNIEIFRRAGFDIKEESKKLVSSYYNLIGLKNE